MSELQKTLKIRQKGVMEMFNLEKEVPNLELCKQLKELGFPQGGGFYWVIENINEKELPRIVYESDIDNGEFIEIIKAPTVRELCEWLPSNISTDISNCLLRIEKTIESNEYWTIIYGEYDFEDEKWTNTEECSFVGNLPMIVAKMLIWLAENGYVNFKKGVKENEA